MSTRFFLAALCVMATLPPGADASVVCGRKDRATGGLAEGATLKVRSACRANEVAADPDALGFRGPQGEEGPIGLAGPIGLTGPPGPGAVVRDADGTLVGSVADAGGSIVRVLFYEVSSGQAVSLYLNGPPALECDSTYSYYPTTDCSGPLLVNSRAQPNDQVLTRSCVNGPTGGTIYAPRSPGVSMLWRSYRPSRGGPCTAGIGMEELTVDFDVVTFVPPFSIQFQ